MAEASAGARREAEEQIGREQDNARVERERVEQERERGREKEREKEVEECRVQVSVPTFMSLVYICAHTYTYV